MRTLFFIVAVAIGHHCSIQVLPPLIERHLFAWSTSLILMTLVVVWVDVEVTLRLLILIQLEYFSSSVVVYRAQNLVLLEGGWALHWGF